MQDQQSSTRQGGIPTGLLPILQQIILVIIVIIVDDIRISSSTQRHYIIHITSGRENNRFLPSAKPFFITGISCRTESVAVIVSVVQQIPRIHSEITLAAFIIKVREAQAV